MRIFAYATLSRCFRDRSPPAASRRRHFTGHFGVQLLSLRYAARDGFEVSAGHSFREALTARPRHAPMIGKIDMRRGHYRRSAPAFPSVIVIITASRPRRYFGHARQTPAFWLAAAVIIDGRADKPLFRHIIVARVSRLHMRFIAAFTVLSEDRHRRHAAAILSMAAVGARCADAPASSVSSPRLLDSLRAWSISADFASPGRASDITGRGLRPPPPPPWLRS